MNPLPSCSIQQKSAAPPVELAGGQPQRPQEAPGHAIAEFIVATVCENLGVQVEGDLGDINLVSTRLVASSTQGLEQRHTRIGSAGLMPVLRGADERRHRL